MAAVAKSLTASDLPEDLSSIRSAVEAAIPVGFAENSSPVGGRAADKLWSAFGSLHARVADREGKAMRQLGTLGGGNHFIELCLDTEDRVWLLLHSGSRNIGKELAERHIAIAKTLEHNAGIPDPDLGVFLAGSAQFAAYRHDLMWARAYARCNRDTMLYRYVDVLRPFFAHLTVGESVNCHHNYVSEESHCGADVLVTRKGAISAKAGGLGIIPGSMGTRSCIVRGLGNPESFCSASHGAGRRMSRGAAKRAFTLDDLASQTAGVECRKNSGVLDEIPAAYKDIDQVMANQADLVEVVHELRQVMCIKG